MGTSNGKIGLFDSLRDKDKFNILYVGECEKTEDKSFFVQHSKLQMLDYRHSGSEKSLHLAILPLV